MRAAADYDIDQYQVNVAIQRDGSANVTQAMTYQFDDDYHGVFNVQDLKGIQGPSWKGHDATEWWDHGDGGAK